MWQDIATFVQNTFGYNDVSVTAQQFPLIRVFVELVGTNADAMFTVHVDTSDL